MNSIAYIGNASKTGYKLKTAIETILPAESLKIFRTPKDLSVYLSKPKTCPETVILLTSNHNELSHILEMRTLFSDRKIILILPDISRKSIAKGCRLFPRYMCDMNSDFMDVVAVLEKVQSNHLISQSEERNILDPRHNHSWRV